MSKKLTILDIAKLAGVGKSTVSRVLTNDPKVKPQTREKVEQIIRESGYVPSKSAQSMRGGSQKVIGVIISRLDSPSENRAVGTMLNALYSAGYDAVIMESQFDRDKTNEHLNVLKRRNVDGVIVFGFTGCDEQALAEWGNRIVVIAMDTNNVSSINYDNQGVIDIALSHLEQQALSRIAYIGVDPEDKTTGLARLNAYKAWCQRKQLTPCFQTGKLSHESAYQLVDHVLKADTQAIVCASDTIALGVIKRLQELGREDVVVTGVGGNELLSFLFPKVFSVDPGYTLAGEKSAKMLINQLNGDEGVVHFTQHPVCR
ncbi:trehalose operon repressor TreR [Vibrio parahaemolyticus]|uniref:trehalose operon repressor TreR n=1 Tax=Vibrio parahaemolyticus TaxID=670 RepID=UPI0006A5E9F3|nr:trehalose operon repressor TreR [Vibrio parahaemolyticus]EGR9013789.1 HTH-type transcriptional regulator TreR [Vibrio parahaemolyticus]EJG1617565.1 HTH-type transcriptional regulator TreR [Vibrio parahaemolyticus]EJG1621694.1 HTH-type transcriptional regulator TreR [Vibrio parahaemolyticus]ELA9291985.1 HTH-type transcriptional regulator TreR [Vibrio parahaemolyticus]KOE78777.1 trehalose repressor [Vibrio parahaemolyticus]